MNLNPDDHLTSATSGTTSFFAMPEATNNELVPYRNALPADDERAMASPFTMPTNTGSATEDVTGTDNCVTSKHQDGVAVAGVVAGIEQRAAEYDRLLALCRQLRATDRCPGICVLSAGRQARLLRDLSREAEL